MSLDLSHVRVVLVNTSHPGNIGAVARAMKNMGMSQLYLVDPLTFPSGEARARASGATDILEHAKVVKDLDAALAGCVRIFGASARLRAISWPMVDPRECAAQTIEVMKKGDIALVMGREHSGLTNAELDRCTSLVHIPANAEYSSLNIAAATQVLVYEIRMAALYQAEQGAHTNRFQSDYPPATVDELEGMYAHFETALEDIGFLNPASPRQLMRRLRRLFNRAHIDRMELNILRGILSAAQDQVKLKKKVK